MINNNTHNMKGARCSCNVLVSYYFTTVTCFWLRWLIVRTHQ